MEKTLKKELINSKDLGEISDSEISRKTGISKQYISQIRNLAGIKSCERTKKRNGKILQYIKQNPFNIIINVLRKTLSVNVTRNIIEAIAKKNNINVSFKEDLVIKNEHSVTHYQRKKCRCEKCKLCHAIYNRFRKHKIFIPHGLINHIGNNFFENYKNDLSARKQNFYKLVDEITNRKFQHSAIKQEKIGNKTYEYCNCGAVREKYKKMWAQLGPHSEDQISLPSEICTRT